MKYVVLFASGTCVGPFSSCDAAVIWHSREGVDVNGDSLKADIIPLTPKTQWVYPARDWVEQLGYT